ncbi:MAG: SUMF1/EgtB/PvdO family nonheme iron enzyme, partial [Chloroflexota bacterium]
PSPPAPVLKPPPAPAPKPPAEPKPQPQPRAGAPAKKTSPMLIGCGALIIIGIVIAAIAGAIGVSMFSAGGKTAEPATHAAADVTHAAATESAASTPIPPAATGAPHATDTAIPLPEIPDGMILIPAGFFQMGSADSHADESPEHPVLLDAYYVDRTEVTNAQYFECVNAGGCTRSGSSRVGIASFDNYPVVLGTWSQAQAYCEWAGKRLPTEAEWEYAAGGPEDTVWPWGNSFDSRLSAASAADVQPVGSYPQGASPFGVMDMAGNAAEWVFDTYSQSFYTDSPLVNPFNGADGATKIFRGGSFGNTDGSSYTTSRRFPKSRSFSDVDIGFRCAKDAHEVNAARTQAERDSLVAAFCEVYLAYKPGAACP